MTNKFRYYQKQADIAISEELLLHDKCIIKMFCGTGKSLLMRYCKINQDQALVAYVFPSLALITQLMFVTFVIKCSIHFYNLLYIYK